MSVGTAPNTARSRHAARLTREPVLTPGTVPKCAPCGRNGLLSRPARPRVVRQGAHRGQAQTVGRFRRPCLDPARSCRGRVRCGRTHVPGRARPAHDDAGVVTGGRRSDTVGGTAHPPGRRVSVRRRDGAAARHTVRRCRGVATRRPGRPRGHHVAFGIEFVDALHRVCDSPGAHLRRVAGSSADASRAHHDAAAHDDAAAASHDHGAGDHDDRAAASDHDRAGNHDDGTGGHDHGRVSRDA